MSLKPLNTPTCPKCRSLRCGRGGYVKEQRGSLWKCKDCGHEFSLKTLVLKQTT